ENSRNVKFRLRFNSASRSSGKSGVKASSITFRFATNKIIPDDSPGKGTIYILNNVPQDYLELTQSSHGLRRLSAKRLGRGGTLGRPTRRSSFLGLMWKPFFPRRMRIKQFNSMRQRQTERL